MIAVLYGMFVFTGLVFLWGIILTFLKKYYPRSVDPVIESVNVLLPQTQCGQCGYPGCRPYAEAIIKNHALINLCPPGGERTIQALAQHLNRDILSLNDVQKPAQLALIEEENCIGCTKCISACPVDAIIGASKQMHTILYDICTGCELCIAPCPTDCIIMVDKNDPRVYIA